MLWILSGLTVITIKLREEGCWKSQKRKRAGRAEKGGRSIAKIALVGAVEKTHLFPAAFF